MKAASESPVVLPIATDLGEFTAHYSTLGLEALHFPLARRKPAQADDSSVASSQVRAWHRLTTRAVQNVLAGKPADELPPFDLSRGTEFQRLVWAGMQTIPVGKTESYGGLAQKVGRPNAVRAVGGACGANPIPVLIPCHRVLAAQGRIGGFSGGLDWKRKLLEREGVKTLD